MPATLTNAGLSVQTYAEILAELKADLQDPVTGFGPLHDVTDPTSPTAVYAAVQARREALHQSLLSTLAAALFPGGAAGATLDRQATITGAAGRIEESNSTAAARLEGDPGTDVSNKLVRHVPTQTLWRTPGAAVLDGAGVYLGTLRAEEPGPTEAEASTEWEIVSTTTGWDLVYTIADAQPGELEESDPTMRERLALTDSVARATEPAIYARLYELPGVTTVVVDNNREVVVNTNGVPGKYAESLVVGGEDEAVARVLHETYSADTGVFGNTSVTFVNDYGKTITMLFSRVDEIQCFAEVTLQVTGAETDLPDDYEDQVRAAVGARAAELSPGQDLMSAFFAGVVADALPTGSVVAVTMAFSTDEGGPFTSTLTIDSRQLALLADGPTPGVADSLQRPEGFDITAGWHLDLSVDGGPTIVTTFAGGVALTATEIAAEVMAALLSADGAAIATGTLNRLRVKTKTTGSTASIGIVNTSTAGLMAELGLDFSSASTYSGADEAIVNVITV